MDLEVPVFASSNFAAPPFAFAVRLAVEAGLAAAAILDVEGKALAVAGALDDDEARAIAAVVTRRLRSPDLLARMLEGEMMTTSLDAREVSIGIAARCVFVVAVLGDPTASRVAVDELRCEVERMISDARADVSGSAPPAGSTGSGGSSSGPAELPVIEYGVTVRRRDPN